MPKTFLVIGCSNALKTHIFLKSFYPEYDFINLSRSGSGNAYIHDVLYNWLDNNPAPDVVYLQFSGLHRIDLYIDGKNDMFSSGGANGSWLYQDRSIINFFKRFYLDENLDKIKNNSLKECLSSINLLANLKIPYVYTWYYDIFNCLETKIEQEGYIKQLPKLFPKETFLNSFPHSYAKKLGLLEDDGCHYLGEESWLQSQISKFPVKTNIRFEEYK